PTGSSTRRRRSGGSRGAAWVGSSVFKRCTSTRRSRASGSATISSPGHGQSSPALGGNPETSDSGFEKVGHDLRGLRRLLDHWEVAAILDRGKLGARDATRGGLPDLPIELRILSAPDDEGPSADAFEVGRHGGVGTSKGVPGGDEGGATGTRLPLFHDCVHPSVVCVPRIVEHGPF